MLIQDIGSGQLASINDVLAKEFIRAGTARRAERRPAPAAGPSVGEVDDPNLAVVDIPAAPE